MAARSSGLRFLLSNGTMHQATRLSRANRRRADSAICSLRRLRRRRARLASATWPSEMLVPAGREHEARNDAREATTRARLPNECIDNAFSCEPRVESDIGGVSLTCG